MSQASSSLSSLYPFMSLLLPCTQVPHSELELGNPDVFMCRCSIKWCKKIKKKARIVRIGTYFCTGFTFGLGKLSHTIFLWENLQTLNHFQGSTRYVRYGTRYEIKVEFDQFYVQQVRKKKKDPCLFGIKGKIKKIRPFFFF